MDVERDLVNELERFRKRCIELEEKNKKDETKCLMLENEVENLKKRNAELEGKIVRVQNAVNDGDDGDDDKFVELMIENKVLECEKGKAERDLCCCKEKVKELEARVSELEMNLKKGVNEEVKDDGFHGRVRKRLSFEEEGGVGFNKKIAPSTPGVGWTPFSAVIDISDEEDIKGFKGGVLSTRSGGRERAAKIIVTGDDENSNADKGHVDSFLVGSSKVVTSDDESGKADNEYMENFEVRSSNTKTAKRKRAVKVVTSDDEDDGYDDTTPISTLIKTRRSSRLRADSEDVVKEESSKKRRSSRLRADSEGEVKEESSKKRRSFRLRADSEDEVKEDASKKRLTRLRKLESENVVDKSGSDLNETVCLHGNASSEEESESEGESLGGFIVESSENESVSDCVSGSDDSCDQSDDGLDDYKVTLEKIGRKKVSNLKWDLEGDMLADFGKDPELCMRAVCVLYRQQTADEKASKGTFYHNARGFSQADAFRASEVAEFLTDGDPDDDLNKTVEELKQRNSGWIKLCMSLAAKYSKQLFQIYQKKEDPYFKPQ